MLTDVNKAELILPIKKHWFDKILSGEKKIEYREIKPYYTSRFSKIWGSDLSEGDIKHRIMLRNGYSVKSPSVIVECTIDRGFKEEPDSRDKEYYRLFIENICEVDI